MSLKMLHMIGYSQIGFVFRNAIKNLTKTAFFIFPIFNIFLPSARHQKLKCSHFDACSIILFPLASIPKTQTMVYNIRETPLIPFVSWKVLVPFIANYQPYILYNEIKQKYKQNIVYLYFKY